MSEAETKKTTEKSDKAATRKRQLAFLKGLKEGNITLPQLLEKTGVTRTQLGKWMTGPSFPKEVRAVSKRLDTLRELDRELYQLVLFDRQSRWLDEAAPTKENRGKVDAEVDTAQRQAKKTKSKKKREVRAHPNTPPEKAQKCMGQMLGDGRKKRASKKKGAGHE